MLRHPSIRSLLYVLLFLAIASCKGPLHWQNDIRGFVEDGLTTVFLRDFEYTAFGMQGGYVPSETQTLVTLDIINPRELAVSYTLTSGDPASLYTAAPVIVDSGPFHVVISFTPSLAAERYALSMALAFFTPQTNREHPAAELSFRCNTPPGDPLGVVALYDGLDRSILRFSLPAGPADDDLNRADVWYEPVDQSLAALTESLDISGSPALVEFLPPGISAGVPYRYRVTLRDSEGLHSGTVQITNEPWSVTTYSLVYQDNGATSGSSPAVQEYEAGTMVTLALPGDLRMTGHLFSHWNSAPDGSGADYYPQKSFSMPASAVTLYAHWVAGTDYDSGDTGPAGGLIFYDKGYYGDPSDDEDWRFMEAAPAPVLPETEQMILQWGGHGTATGATLSVIGSGLENTTTIIAALGSGFSHPAMEADAYATGGFSDWFLPSIHELTQMYEVLHDQGVPLGGFLPERYWSSTEGSSTFARAYHFGEGGGYILQKNQTGSNVYIRPARRF